jgi:hypothetical protein
VGLDARSQYAVLRQGEKWEKYASNAATLKVKYHVNAHTQVRNCIGVMFAVWHLTRLCISKIDANVHTGENLPSL